MAAISLPANILLETTGSRTREVGQVMEESYSFPAGPPEDCHSNLEG